jgi:hypothetical protein
MIPLTFHFIFGLQPDFGGKPFSFIHYMAVKSALAVHPGAKALFHYEHEPRGIYWEVARSHVECVRVQAPREVSGRPLEHVAHQADVLRLQILLERGGIYLDLDTITVRSFAPLLVHGCVMGRQGRQGSATDRGLCNAVILAEPKHPFLRAWLDEYRHFRSRGGDEFWDEHSVVVPGRLAASGKYPVTLLEPEAFFHPSYDNAGIGDLFIENQRFPEAYCHHLWESNAWHVAARINERNVGLLENTYCGLARRHLGEDAQVFERLRKAELREALAQGAHLNLGCGVQRMEGWVNVDREPETGPDLQFDLAARPWPLPDGCATEVNLSHVLEHTGEGFRSVIQELYRVCRDGALVHVRVPGPAHEWFWTDPEHNRPVVPETLSMLDRELCKARMIAGDTKTPLAIYWNVDFVLEKSMFSLDPQFEAERVATGMADDEVMKRARYQTNVVAEYMMDLRVRKRRAA